MLTQPQTVLIFLSISFVVFWVLPPSKPRTRAWWLILVSCACIGYVSLSAVLALILLSVWTGIFENFIYHVRRKSNLQEVKKKRVIKLLVRISIIGLVFPLVFADFSQNFFVLLGLSYVVLKSISVILDATNGVEKAGIGKILLLNSFFPIYASGPIESAQTFAFSKLSKVLPSFKDIVVGIHRFLEGMFITYFLGQTLLAEMLKNYTGVEYINDNLEGKDIIFFIILKFLYLYANFSGYTSIAVGMSRLFGVQVSENFNYPLLARNPQEFWQRWHISLGNFLNKYVYLRILVLLKRPYFSLFLAFLVVGLWHKVNIQYFVWGCGHGGALVAFLYVKQKNKEFYEGLTPLTKWIIGVFGGGVTWFWVAFLSFIANAPSLDYAVKVVLRLVI